MAESKLLPLPERKYPAGTHNRSDMYNGGWNDCLAELCKTEHAGMIDTQREFYD